MGLNKGFSGFFMVGDDMSGGEETHTHLVKGGGLPGNHRVTRTDADRSSIAVLAATSFKHAPMLWRDGSHSIGLRSLLTCFLMPICKVLYDNRTEHEK